MNEKPETLIGVFIKQLNAKLADEYRNLTVENKELRTHNARLRNAIKAYLDCHRKRWGHCCRRSRALS